MEDIFTNYELPQRNEKFKKELIKERGYRCEKCGNSFWLDQKINLELHHIDGNRRNCTRENLQLLCPNCHSFTENFGSKNKNHPSVSDDDILEALKTHRSIRQALLSLGLSDAGANYNKARTLMNQNGICFTSKKENYCVDCGKPICLEAKRCVECNIKNSQRGKPSREVLKARIKKESFVAIGKSYSVSDNAVRKWCKGYNLPATKKEIKTLTEQQWKEI